MASSPATVIAGFNQETQFNRAKPRGSTAESEAIENEARQQSEVFR